MANVTVLLSLVCCLILLQGSIVNFVMATGICLRRRKLLQNAILISAKLVRKRRKWQNRRPRRFWVKPGRTSSWWDNMLNGVCLDSDWKDNFRMSRCNFEKLCDDLRPLLERRTTRMRKPLSVETQVAVTLYYLCYKVRYFIRACEQWFPNRLAKAKTFTSPKRYIMYYTMQSLPSP
jgi:hypothetical protein